MGLFFEMGRKLAEGRKSYGIVLSKNEQYAILTKTDLNYICVKVLDTKGNKCSINNKVFIIIDIEGKPIKMINCLMMLYIWIKKM